MRAMLKYATGSTIRWIRKLCANSHTSLQTSVARIKKTESQLRNSTILVRPAVPCASSSSHVTSLMSWCEMFLFRILTPPNLDYLPERAYIREDNNRRKRAWSENRG